MLHVYIYVYKYICIYALTVESSPSAGTEEKGALTRTNAESCNADCNDARHRDSCAMLSLKK